jgi:hypothetical protein
MTPEQHLAALLALAQQPSATQKLYVQTEWTTATTSNHEITRVAFSCPNIPFGYGIHESKMKAILVVVDADAFRAAKELAMPQWQTGPIPEPTGLSVLAVEDHIAGVPILYASDEGCSHAKWYVNSWSMTPNECRLEYTGRWFIQPIILPE